MVQTWHSAASGECASIWQEPTFHMGRSSSTSIVRFRHSGRPLQYR